MPQERKVIVNDKSGGKLVGILHEAGSVDIVVLCHGFMSSKVTIFVSCAFVSKPKSGVLYFVWKVWLFAPCCRITC